MLNNDSIHQLRFLFKLCSKFICEPVGFTIYYCLKILTLTKRLRFLFHIISTNVFQILSYDEILIKIIY